MNKFRLLTLPAIALCLGACFGNHNSTLGNFHLLTARAQPVATAPANFTVGVGPVHVAQFLNRPQIVTHAGSANLQLNDSQRWGEPLEQGVQRVLAQNIGTLLGAETRNFPWRQSLTPDYAVRIDIIDLDKLSDGSALLDVSWALEDLKNARIVKTRQEQLRSSAGIGEHALADAYSDLLLQLAQDISAQLPKQ